MPLRYLDMGTAGVPSRDPTRHDSYVLVDFRVDLSRSAPPTAHQLRKEQENTSRAVDIHRNKRVSLTLFLAPSYGGGDTKGPPTVCWKKI